MFDFLKKKEEECVFTSTWVSILKKCSNCHYYSKRTKRQGECGYDPKKVYNARTDKQVEIKRSVCSYYVCDNFEGYKEE